MNGYIKHCIFWLFILFVIYVLIRHMQSSIMYRPLMYAYMHKNWIFMRAFNISLTFRINFCHLSFQNENSHYLSYINGIIIITKKNNNVLFRTISFANDGCFRRKKIQSIRVILADIKRRKITKRKHYHGGSKRIFTCMGNR